MAVYVDTPIRYPRTLKWKYGQACHMFADSVDELHSMACKIGLRRSWFQPSRTLDHYDLTAFKRSQAISLGTVPVSSVELVAFIRKVRDAKRGQL